jgi:ankyrin repeat protein
VNEADYHDFTCLHYATMWGNYGELFTTVLKITSLTLTWFAVGWASTVKLLLDSNADINAVNIGGKTALMMAVDYEHEDVLTLLSRQKTIQLDIADSEGYRNDYMQG